MHSTLAFKTLFVVPLFLAFFPFGTKAFGASSGPGTEWSQKVEKKAAQRWTLQEWLQQKERNRWMDQWLMMHTPTPYEFALEVKSLSYTLTSDAVHPQHRTVSGSFTAYATMVGLEFQNNNNASEGIIDNTGLFHIRILGAADQGSHLTLSFGQQTRHFNNLNLPLRSQYLGQTDLTLYFNNHVGLKALHKSFYPLTNDVNYGDVTGYWQSVDIFIDFAALRIFGGAYREKETQTLNGATQIRTIEGAQGGLRLYF
jgi:hypothetical protein